MAQRALQFGMLIRTLVLLAAAALAAAAAADDDANDTLVPQEVLDSIVRSGAGLDAALELWEPRALASAWPRMAPALGGACRRQLATLLESLGDADLDAGVRDAGRRNAWATRVLDASGRYSRRLHSGNGFWLGSRELCSELDDAAATEAQDGATPPFRLSFHVAKVAIDHELLPKERQVEMGLCVPAACVARDSRAALEALGAERPRNMSVTAVRVVSATYSLWNEPRFHAMLGATVVVAFLVILATLYDFCLLDTSKTNTKEHSADINERNNNINIIKKHDKSGSYNANALESVDGMTCIKVQSTTFKYDTHLNGTLHNVVKDIKKGDNQQKKIWKWREDVSDSICMQILLSFSLRTNFQKLGSLNGGDDTLTPIHGLRVFTLMWIVLVHACLITFQNADNKQLRMKAEQDFLFQTLSSGTYSVDTFFVISGMLVSFLYFRTMSKMTLKELTSSAEGYKSTILQFIGMTIYRFIRLTPPYLYVLGIVSLTTQYYHEHAVMELPTKDHITCEKYWWRNMLYINTFYPEKERCMVWSWYLANDTQFYTIGTILLILSVTYFQAAVAFVGFLLLSAWTTTAVLTINTQHRPSIEDPFANYEDLYDKPWIRVGPYLIGMCAGWILCKLNCQLNLHKGWIILCWSLAISTMVSVVYGLYGTEFGPVLSAVYVALGHSAWAVAVAWIVIACCTGNGGFIDKILSWPYLYPISRLSYCTYLIHPQIMRIILLNYDSSFHITIDMMGAVFGGFLLTSYAAALIITLTFEAPVVSLLRIAHPMRRRKAS